MAVTNADILGWLNANPGASDALIASTMQAAGVSPAQMAQATGLGVGEVTARFEAAVAPAYFQANPDVAAAYADNSYGMSAKEFSDYHYDNYGANEQRAAPAAVSAPALTVEDLYRQYAGREADPGGLEFWKQGFGDSIDANEIASFQNAVAEARAQGTEPAAATPAATTPAVTQGALAQAAPVTQAAAIEPDIVFNA